MALRADVAEPPPPQALQPTDGGFVFAFRAMGSPCEVRMDTDDPELAARLGGMAQTEALRIEHKYSRYRADSLLSAINASEGQPVRVDPETAELLDYAAQFHGLSDGRFDITSGVLRRVWRFDQSDRVPSGAEVDAVLPFVGWDRVTWRRPQITLPQGMEIDFGGLGKEYAVDTTALKLQAASGVPFLVNFGGDLRVSGPRANGDRWRVAIESVETPSTAEAVLELARGALTTSGDAQRYLLKDGVRYGHILDPRTGWSVANPPRSVTVAAPSCMEAGLISTLAMLHGEGAEAFLEAEGVEAWWQR